MSARNGYSSEVIVRHVPPVPNPILGWLAEHVEGTAQQIARDLGRDPDGVGAGLRALRNEGRVRRVREEQAPTGGRPRPVYELVRQHNEEEVPEVDSTTVYGSTVGVGVERKGVADEDMRMAAAQVELTPEDMEELLAAYCGTLTLAEAASTTLLFVLRMRRVQDKLTEVAGGS